MHAHQHTYMYTYLNMNVPHTNMELYYLSISLSLSLSQEKLHEVLNHLSLMKTFLPIGRYPDVVGINQGANSGVPHINYNENFVNCDPDEKLCWEHAI